MGPMTVGIKRLVEVAAPISALPPVDMIVLSTPTWTISICRVCAGWRIAELMWSPPRRRSDLLRRRRYAGVHEARWNHTIRVGPAAITAFQVQHWGARLRSDTYRGYNGYLIEIGKYRLVFGGDTAYTDAFRQVKTSRPVNLAIMPIGAYDPWIRVHCNPEQAWTMANHAGADFRASGSPSDL